MRIGEYLSFGYSIENDLKQADVLLPLLFHFDLEFAIKKVQETNLGLNMNSTHQVESS